MANKTMEEIKDSINDVMVSVNCLVYNHEPFLRQCLDGFVIQKTNFKFEVLIHDDASTDKSAEIIREYEQKYPDIIKPIYQTENQYSKRIRINFTYQYPRAKGKYMAFCEGDDYWTDPYKLQKQFDAMEAHPECSICVHNVNVFESDTQKSLGNCPSVPFSDGVVEISTWVNKRKSRMAYFQTTSYFIRLDYLREYINEYPEFSKVSLVGDTPMFLYMVTKGKIFNFSETMSYYRKFSTGSWTSNFLANPEYVIEFYKKVCKMYFCFNKYTNYCYDRSLKKEMKSALYICYVTAKKNKVNLNIEDVDIKLSKMDILGFRLHYLLSQIKRKILQGVKGNK